MKYVWDKVVGSAGAVVMSVAFVSLFASMGASGVALAKTEGTAAQRTVVKLERIEVVAKREARSKDMAMNTQGVKARAL